jgi:K+-sensing histidine kinase KdpD
VQSWPNRLRETPMKKSIVAALESIVAVTLTTFVLMVINTKIEVHGLIIGYLFPVTLIAIHHGSMLAFLTAALSVAAAAYFVLTPKFSFYISDPRDIAELVFLTLLALIGAKTTALLMHDDHKRRPPISQ